MAKKRLKSLEELKSLQMELKKARAPEPEPQPAPKPKRPAKRFGLGPAEARQAKVQAQPSLTPEEEEKLFSQAMSGVKPLNPTLKGREVDPETDPAPPRWTGVDETALADLNRFVAGELEFEIEYSDEYMFGRVKGLDAKAFNQLKAGALSMDAHLDLHGLNADQARDSLLFFLHECYLQNKRCVLLVPGRGKNSPGGQSVLRQEIQAWLTQEPLKRMVMAYCTAQPKHGGAGALYVMLRRYRKSIGKVMWDRG
jgi:DNA-nicking Smr family endonuclease